MTSSFSSAPDLATLLGVHPTSTPDEYESRSPPERMGNTANIAYGGCALGVALSAAHGSTDRKYRFYSALGTYLAPALTDRRFFCSVRKIRDTKTFATRQVEVSQCLDLQDDSKGRRVCMLVIADFQVPEKASLLTYSAPPILPTIKADELPGLDERQKIMQERGLISPKVTKTYSIVFGLMRRHWDMRPHPSSVFAQNASGMAKHLPTSQDSLPLYKKTSGDYYRCRQKLETQGENIAALGFMLDGAISFLPLTHSGMFLDDAGACSSLEFALRVFTDRVELGDWHFKEMNTITGGNGRTYSEARLWNGEGEMVCSMTQQSILRVKPTKAVL